MTAEKITKAKEGDTFRMKRKTESFTVGSKCDKNEGHWVCTTHGESFANPMQKDSHIRTGKHVLAWFCLPCGKAEVP